jgi:hypothetical protein
MSFWNGREWVADSPPAEDVKREGRVKHVTKALLEAGLITALTFGLIAGSAFAAKPTSGGTGGRHGGGSTTGGGTIAFGSVVVDQNGDGSPNWRDSVIFNISTSASSPFVNLVCAQGGVTVMISWRGYFAGSLDTDWSFGLSSGAWTSGAANCTAYLKTQNSHGGWNTLASTSFPVGA